MVESVPCFPFRKLIYDNYLTLEVMMYLDFEQVLKFMFFVNKEGRAFLNQHFLIIKNGFVNEGLITHQLDLDFNGYYQLEKLYYQALTKNI